jgi:molybdopterin converting factor small subunit
VKILVQGLSKAKALKYQQTEPFFTALIEKIEDQKIEKLTIEDEALVRNVRSQLEKAVSLGKSILPDIMGVVENIEEPGRLADLISSNIGLKAEQSQEMLEISDPIKRLKRIGEVLSREIDLLTVQQKIQSEARGEIDKTQREYFLREQHKAIQKELGDIDERAEEIREFRKKIEDARMPEKVLKEAEKQKAYIAETKAKAEELLNLAKAKADGIAKKQKDEPSKEAEKKVGAILAEAKIRAEELVNNAKAEAEKQSKAIIAEAWTKAEEVTGTSGASAGAVKEEIEKLKNLKSWHEKDFESFLTFTIALIESWKKGADNGTAGKGRSDTEALRGEVEKLKNYKNQLEKYFDSFLKFNKKLLESRRKENANWEEFK